MTCDHCHNDVPDGVFCTRCGAHQATVADVRDPKGRLHSFAAQPGEHVAQPSVFTTLFPHLGYLKAHEFRWAFLAGVAGIFILVATGLVTGAILVAAFLVPVLYLIYLYEAQVYRNEPATVLGFTIGGGVIVGIVVTVITDRFVNPLSLAGVGVDLGAIIVATVIIPIVQEVVKPIAPLVLWRSKRFPETVDGLVFGVAAGLGFSVAETLIQFSNVIVSQPFRIDPGSWIFPLIGIAVLNPLLQGSTTGAITAAIWPMTRFTVQTRAIGGIAVAVVGHVAFSLGSRLLILAGQNQFVVLGWEAVVVVGVLLYVRYLLHTSLMQEAKHMGFFETVCPHCHKHIVASSFCPSCGIALGVSPGYVTDARKPRVSPGEKPAKGSA
ncbi:MAG TPA: PrsW family glutamic-type intramembrane protease [Candidatus Dormibacteraeota bacterium]|nr:PrsW family glutamic-type intramembrane protease [Candidatus Dormibacteraeota bacterium]